MKNCYKPIYLFFLIQVVLFISELTAQGKYNKLSKTGSVAKANNKYVRTLLNINNLSSWIDYDGYSGGSRDGSSGIWYPRGTGTVIYLDGFFWGGFVQDPDTSKPSLRVCGQKYRIGTTPGRIISTGVAQSSADPDVRIYRIRSDWQTISDNDLRLDAAELYDIDISEVTPLMVDGVLGQYALDWNEWPAEYGAPFYDLNDNGIYELGLGEEPGMQNADQVIWFVCNDLPSGATKSFAGSPPIGLELQVTLWGYKAEGALGQTQFRIFRLINKSGFAIDSMYVGQWSDPDVGSAGDDYVGCDTLLNLGYCYNGYNTDSGFQIYNLPPPAIGYTLLKGPMIPSFGDIAYSDFKQVINHKNLPMTSFGYEYPKGWAVDPDLGWYGETIELYNWLQGYDYYYSNKRPYIIGSGPDIGKITKFPLSGDPVLGTGDLDGQGNNPDPSDRRFLLSSGPFTMQPEEMQEIIIALVGGINPAGDHLTSITELKNNVSLSGHNILL